MPGGFSTDVPPLRERPAWAALERHYDEIKGTHLRELFAADPTRGERLTAQGAGLYLDYSKNRIADETLGLLIELAEQSGLHERTRRCSPGSESTSQRTALSCTSRCACPRPPR